MIKNIVWIVPGHILICGSQGGTEESMDLPEWWKSDKPWIIGDCLEGMKDIPGNSVDLIITSPPYNKRGFRGGKEGHANSWKADMNYGIFDDNMTEEDYWGWQNNLFAEAKRVLKESGSFFYNHKVRRFGGKAHHPLQSINTDLYFYQQIVWDRGSGTDGNLRYLNPITELIFWYIKDTPIVNKRECKYNSEVWRIPPEANTEHPAPFPPTLIENLIRLASDPGQIVLDPFLGRGTILRATRKTGRIGLGFEINPAYEPLIRKYSLEDIKPLEGYFANVPDSPIPKNP